MKKEGVVNFIEEDTADTIMYLAINKQYIGFLTMGDQIKDQVKETITTMHQNGIKTSMLTGDNEKVALSVGLNLGIKNIHASLLPQDKVKCFEDIIKQEDSKHKTIFVGDGINDAPVLSLADIGIAMGGVGSDAAIEVADIIIMNDNINKINEAIAISKFTKKIALQNIIFAFTIKFLAIILGLYGFATIWEAVLADAGVAIIAVFNAMRILKYKGDQ
ncbi:MAG: HAD-IC family P-type ATPase, partial [Bacilli bacterium]